MFGVFRSDGNGYVSQLFWDTYSDLKLAEAEAERLNATADEYVAGSINGAPVFRSEHYYAAEI